MISPFHKLYQQLVIPVRRSPWLHRVLYGYSPVAVEYGGLWDWTTIALRNALRRDFQAGMSLLDVGTGPYGVLALYACRRLHAGDVTACDHVDELIAHANRQ